jgi:hypothetical protein
LDGEKGDLLTQLEEARKTHRQSDDQLSILYQRMVREDTQDSQAEANFRKEISELSKGLRGASEKRKLNTAKQ